METESEHVLGGGTTSGIVKVGDTVRRPAGRWTETNDALLRHLEAQGFPAPRALGRDALGRQVLSWIEGETTWDRHSEYWNDLDQLRTLGQLVRRLHDLLDSFVAPPNALWRDGWGGTVSDGPICHRDLAPYNVVMTPAGDLAVIDWDGARPGDRLMELAYVMDGFALLRRDVTWRQLGYASPGDRVERVEAIWDGYAPDDTLRPALSEALVVNARDRALFGRTMHEERREPWASWWAEDHGAGDEEDLAVTEAVATGWLGR